MSKFFKTNKGSVQIKLILNSVDHENLFIMSLTLLLSCCVKFTSIHIYRRSVYTSK